jgi:hypothetical protein
MNMKNILLKVLITIVSILDITCIAVAEVPNTLSSGTTAQTNEVNAKLQHVNYGNIVVKANGVEIGACLGVANTGNGNGIGVLNANGYNMIILPYEARISSAIFYYTTSDCTGTAYASISRSQQFAIPGTIINDANNLGQLFYICKNCNPIDLTTSLYVKSGGSCMVDKSSGRYYPLTPNDPTVTGVNAHTFAMPITVDRR